MPWVERAAAAALVLWIGVAAPLTAQAQDAPDPPDRRLLGRAWLFTNDALGDGQDRWHSLGFSFGAVAGPPWSGRLPGRIGEVLEYRIVAEAIAPANLVRPDPADRRYAGVLSVGLHSHLALGPAEARLGADLVAVGPRTGVARLHEALHDLLRLSDINPDSARLSNAVYPTVSGEVALPLDLGRHARIRPFVDARWGDEDVLRAGADLTLGAVQADALWLRDPMTGHRTVAVRDGAARGLFVTLGGDVAAVADSAWLPDGGAVVARDHRTRLRAGVGHAGRRLDAFYGLTWLSDEFVGQDGSQVVGSVSVRLRF